MSWWLSLLLILVLPTTVLCQPPDLFGEINTLVTESRNLLAEKNFLKAETVLLGALAKIDELGPSLRTSATKPLALLAMAQFSANKEGKARQSFYKALDLAESIGNDGLFFETAYLVLEGTEPSSGAAHALRERLQKLEDKKEDDKEKTNSRMAVATHCVLGRHALKGHHPHSALLHYQKAYRLAKAIDGKIVSSSGDNGQMLSLIPLIFAETGLAATFSAMGHKALAKNYTLKLLITLKRTLKYKVLENHIAIQSAKQMLLTTVRK